MKDTLPITVTPGTTAWFNDPAGKRSRGTSHIQVVLTGEQGTFNDGTRWFEIYNSAGEPGRTLSAFDLTLTKP